MFNLLPNNLRKIALKMIYEANSGHIGGSFSIAELIVYLFNTYTFNKDKTQDILILSKGHAVPIIYAALNQMGIITDDELLSFRNIDSRLEGHPVKTKIPELFATTGSLGQGISMAIGHAVAKKKLGLSGRVFCIIGDGEIQEGQVWEALMFLNREKLNNISIIIDNNHGQNDGDTLPFNELSDILKSMSFDYRCVKNGNNLIEISKAFKNLENKSHVVNLQTKKGYGVDFMQSSEWHGKIPSLEEYNEANKQLSN